MCAALEHRGPDARGAHVDGPVGLGAQRLRVIDLETGDQPIYNEDRSVVVVHNGEIYNHDELRSRLQGRGHRFATRTDTEVIVHLYEEEGPECVRSLHGMFAFALWDAARRRLVLARDRLGKKPLLYADRPHAFTFASEMGALLADPDIPREVDPEAIDRFLAYQYVPAPFTAFRAVRKLPPGHVLVVDEEGSELSRYWQPDFARKRAVASQTELQEELLELMRRAVRRRMTADVPLGAFLSGGIDSSTVVALMAEESSRPVKTFSIGFASERFDELPHARRVAERFATDHQELVVDLDATALLPRLVRHYGEPFGDASALPTFRLAEMARRDVTVALAGDGGDEAFGGYPRYVSNALAGRLDRVPAPVRKLVARLGARVPAGAHVDSTASRVRRLATGLAGSPLARYVAQVSYGLDRDRLYSPGFRDALAGTDPSATIAEPWEASAAPSLLDKMLDVDIQTYLPGDLLVKMDIASMAHSLEVRAPLLDQELLEFAVSLPPELKVSGLQKKVLLRDTMRSRLPDGIVDRPKRGFEVPLAEWFRGKLGGTLREVLFDESARSRGYFDEGALRDLVERHAAGVEDNGQKLWALMMLELWHREFADAPARRPGDVEGLVRR
jgi:asparagine synthase (glutamine-hydrolysing)